MPLSSILINIFTSKVKYIDLYRVNNLEPAGRKQGNKGTTEQGVPPVPFVPDVPDVPNVPNVPDVPDVPDVPFAQANRK